MYLATHLCMSVQVLGQLRCILSNFYKRSNFSFSSRKGTVNWVDNKHEKKMDHVGWASRKVAWSSWFQNSFMHLCEKVCHGAQTKFAPHNLAQHFMS
jgi:hypothetical protein